MANLLLPNMPRHIAIVMDGNGRWARKRHLPREAGHVAGVSAVRETVRAASDVGLENLTLFAFSSENWKRPKTEVGALMGLFRAYFRSDMNELVARGVRVRIIGHRGRVAGDIQRMIEDAETRTVHNKGLNLTFAFDYGGQEEIANAARELARAAAEGRLDPETITPELFATRLFTSALPEPDLVIRTSGERRLSNFMLWQSAYAELLFVETLWPDFGRAELIQAIESFGARERRFGAVNEGAVAMSAQPHIPRASRDHAPGFKAIRWNMDWITRPLFGVGLAALAIFALTRDTPVYFASLMALIALPAAHEWHRMVARGRAFRLETAITAVTVAVVGAVAGAGCVGRRGPGAGGAGRHRRRGSGGAARQFARLGSPGRGVSGPAQPGFGRLAGIPAARCLSDHRPVRDCLGHRYRRADLRQSDRRPAPGAEAFAQQDLGRHLGRQRDRGRRFCRLLIAYLHGAP